MKKINKKNFKKVLSKFATGVTIVAINFKNKKIGKTINSFSSLSLNPPLILFSLDKKSSSLNEFKKSEYLSINILSINQNKISENFSKKNAKWKNIEFKYGEYKSPILKNCIGNLECKKIKLLNEGDHLIFICKVINVSIKDKVKPLLYYNSKYL